MKRIVLDSTIALNAVMSGAPATNQPTFHVVWADKSSGSPFVLGFDRGSLNGTTEVELVGSPASGTDRVIRSFSIVNIDTADVTVKLYTDDTTTEVDLPEITLNPGDEWTEKGVFDSQGRKKVATSADASEIADLINNSSEKTTPVDGDKIPLLDSAASFVLKWFSWSTLKNFFATLSGGNTFLGVQDFADRIDANAGISFDGGVNVDTGDSGVWTPIDASGAGLSLTVSENVYEQIGPKTYRIQTRIDFPVTADTSGVLIGGSPEVPSRVAAGAVFTGSIVDPAVIIATTGDIFLYSSDGGFNRVNNNEVSGSYMRINIIFQV